VSTFTVNPTRLDPYKSYRFLVYFGTSTTPVAAVSKVTAVKRTTDVIEYKEGGNNIILQGPGRTKYEPITLERGITYDNAFMNWADATQKLDQGHPVTSLANMRQEITIALLNEEGQTVHGITVHRCWVSEYQAFPDLDAGANAIALEHIKLQNEGWEFNSTMNTEQAET